MHGPYFDQIKKAYIDFQDRYQMNPEVVEMSKFVYHHLLDEGLHTHHVPEVYGTRIEFMNRGDGEIITIRAGGTCRHFAIKTYMTASEIRRRNGEIPEYGRSVAEDQLDAMRFSLMDKMVNPPYYSDIFKDHQRFIKFDFKPGAINYFTHDYFNPNKQEEGTMYKVFVSGMCVDNCDTLKEAKERATGRVEAGGDVHVEIYQKVQIAKPKATFKAVKPVVKKKVRKKR